jgi:hypothetical protein
MFNNLNNSNSEHLLLWIIDKTIGGSGEIRTHDTVARMSA